MGSKIICRKFLIGVGEENSLGYIRCDLFEGTKNELINIIEKIDSFSQKEYHFDFSTKSSSKLFESLGRICP